MILYRSPLSSFDPKNTAAAITSNDITVLITFVDLELFCCSIIFSP